VLSHTHHRSDTITYWGPRKWYLKEGLSLSRTHALSNTYTQTYLRHSLSHTHALSHTYTQTCLSHPFSRAMRLVSERMGDWDSHSFTHALSHTHHRLVAATFEGQGAWVLKERRTETFTFLQSHTCTDKHSLTHTTLSRIPLSHAYNSLTHTIDMTMVCVRESPLAHTIFMSPINSQENSIR